MLGELTKAAKKQSPEEMRDALHAIVKAFGGKKKGKKAVAVKKNKGQKKKGRAK